MAEPLKALIYRIHPAAKLPTKATSGSAGYDLYSIENYQLHIGRTIKVRTGLVIKPPPGYFSSIRGRSSLGSKYGIGIPHGLGTIDSDFSGSQDELIVILHRLIDEEKWGKELIPPYVIKAGDRVAQLLFECHQDILLEEDSPEELLNGTSRGGLGSSGR